MTDVKAGDAPCYPESWALTAVPPSSASAGWWQAARPYLGFALLAALTVAAIYGLVVWLPNLAGASAPGGCGGG